VSEKEFRQEDFFRFAEAVVAASEEIQNPVKEIDPDLIVVPDFTPLTESAEKATHAIEALTVAFKKFFAGFKRDELLHITGEHDYQIISSNSGKSVYIPKGRMR
jgi:hypothetical protein